MILHYVVLLKRPKTSLLEDWLGTGLEKAWSALKAAVSGRVQLDLRGLGLEFPRKILLVEVLASSVLGASYILRKSDRFFGGQGMIMEPTEEMVKSNKFFNWRIMYRHRMTTKSCSISSPSWICSSSSSPWTFQPPQLSGHQLPSFCWTWGSFSRTRKMTSPVSLISSRFWTLMRSNYLPSNQMAFRWCLPPEEVGALFLYKGPSKTKSFIRIQA